MARAGLSATVQAELVKGSLRAANTLKLDFPGGALNTTQAGFQISYNGDTYSNDGRLLGMSGVTERTDGKPGMLSISLSPDTTVRARIDDDDWQYSKVYPRLVLLDSKYAVIDSISLGVYYMSTAQHQIGMGEASIHLECEPLIVDLSRHHPVLPSTRDQARRSSGDTYFDAVSAIVGMRLEWGGRPAVVPYMHEISPGGPGNPRTGGALSPPQWPVPGRTLSDFAPR